MPASKLHAGTATGQGTWRPFANTAVITARLGAAGGTATCNLYGRVNAGDPPYLMATFTLSGANDSARAIVIDEPWTQVMGEIQAIGGGATVTMTIGGA